MPVEALGAYDQNNVFARILRGELPAKQVYADDHALAFHDLNPQAPVHVLIIPRGPWRSWADFSAQASDTEISGYIRAIGHVAKLLGLETPGYRLLANAGLEAGQEVPHLHVHLFGGQPLGPMLASS